MFLTHAAWRMKDLLEREDGDRLRVEMWNVECAERGGGSNMKFPEKKNIFRLNPSDIFLASCPASLVTGWR